MPTYMVVFKSSHMFVLRNSGKLYQNHSSEVREDSKREKQTLKKQLYNSFGHCPFFVASRTTQVCFYWSLVLNFQIVAVISLPFFKVKFILHPCLDSFMQRFYLSCSWEYPFNQDSLVVEFLKVYSLVAKWAFYLCL